MSEAAFLTSLRAAERDAVAELITWRERVTRGEALLKSIRDCIAAYVGEAAPAPQSAPSVQAMLQRDPNPLEEAEAYAALIASDPKRWTVSAIADAKGKTKRYVEQRLALVNKLPAEAKQQLRSGEITVTEARAIVTQPKTQPALVPASSDVGEKINTAARTVVISPTEFTVWRALAKRISETGLSPLYAPFARETGVGIMAMPRTIDALVAKGFVRRTGNRRTTMLHVDKWPDGIAPRETRGREDGVGTAPRASATHPSAAGGKPARRFDHANFDPENVASLAPGHPAMQGKRTLFQETVKPSVESPRLLISGINQRKLGDRVTKGAWKGMPIFALTLEERKTCPTTCAHLGDCYGNGMPLARRHKVDADFWPKMHGELAALQAEHPSGFVVRLHVLGDFPDVDYVTRWADALGRYPALHIFGYTAWLPTTNIGYQIQRLRDSVWGRFAIRFSSPQSLKGGATTITRRDRGQVPEGIVCPAQTNDTDCCGSCGLCWADAAKAKTIVFMMHGRRKAEEPTKPAPVRAAKPVSPPAAMKDAPVAQAPRAAPAPRISVNDSEVQRKPNGVSIGELEAKIMAAVDRLGTKATTSTVAGQLGCVVTRITPTVGRMLQERKLRLVETASSKTRYLARPGSIHDPDREHTNDRDLNDAIAICRHDGDDVVRLGNGREWRVNGRETLDREALIARGRRLAEKRRVLGKSA